VRGTSVQSGTAGFLAAGTGMVLAAVVLWSLQGAGDAAPAAAAASDVLPPRPFAVVELYTSEGCSSCPPADRVLADLVARAHRDGTRIYPLAFHVDYWNRLGWKDPWSQAAFSARQSMYAGAFAARYTPQMIVNGSDSFVGSDGEHARRSIETALAAPAAAAVEARLVRAQASRELRVLWQVRPVSRPARLHVALVERGLESRVERGENRGRTLRHDNVVRFFATAAVPENGRGETDVVPPRDARLEACSIIVYLQSPKSHRVLGATGLEIDAAPATGR
jgi:hypothetical protein